MKMKSKICLIVAAAMLASTVLTACNNGNSNNSTSSASSVVQTTDDDGRKMEGNMYLEGRPLVKEQETFSLFVDGTTPEEDIIMYPILEEQTNVHVELMLNPNETAIEKKNILLNSGDYPDVFGGWIFGGDRDILTQGMEEQIYIPLDELIEKYSPKMREILDIEGVRSTMTLPDGHIYTVPYVIGEPKVTFLPFINQKWLDNLKLEMPTTTDELYNVLKAFKEQDANGNGDPNDEIPYTEDPNNRGISTLAGWWGVNASVSGINKYFAMVDGQLEFNADEEGFKEAIKYFAKLYSEGLVDSEIFTQDNATWKGKGNKDLYGVSFAYGAGDFAIADLEMHPDYLTRTAYEPLPVLTAKEGVKPVFRRNGYGVTTFRTQVVITDAAKNPATIIRWFDNVFDIDNSVQIQAGLFDHGVVKLGEGDYQYVDGATRTDEDKEKYGWGNMFTQSLPKYIPTSLVIKDADSKYKNYKEKDICDALYEPYLDQNPPQAWVAADVASRLGILETDINNFIETKIAEWVSGQRDIDADWDTYLKDLDGKGLQELIKIRQDAVASVK